MNIGIVLVVHKDSFKLILLMVLEYVRNNVRMDIMEIILLKNVRHVMLYVNPVMDHKILNVINVKIVPQIIMGHVLLIAQMDIIIILPLTIIHANHVYNHVVNVHGQMCV